MAGRLEAVAGHVETVLARARDRWGEPTPLLADGFGLGIGEPVRWRDAALSNLACQQNLLRTLDGLAALTGESRWSEAAAEWIGHALRVLPDRDSDLFYWGGHSAWDLGTDAALRGNHELKCAYPFYDHLFRIDGEATSRFVEAFWHAHVWDWSSLLFNRHGEYESWDRSRRWWEGAFDEAFSVPIIENRALSFINTGSDLIWAACELHRLSGQTEPLQWALRLLSRYEAIRDPGTGLAGYQFNHREPCRVRQSFTGQVGERADVNETTVVTNTVIGTRCGRVAVIFLNIAETLGPEDAEPFRQLVRRDLTALAEHCWDEGAGVFHAAHTSGLRLSPADTEEVGYCPPGKLRPVRADGLLFLAYARAYRVLGDPRFQEMAQAVGRAIGWGRLDQGPVDFQSLGHVSTRSEDVRAHGGQTGACALEGMLDLYRATGSEDLLAGALSLGDRLLREHVVGGLFTSSGGRIDGPTGIDSAVPVALLRLEALDAGANACLPALVANLSDFHPKILERNRAASAQGGLP